MKSNLNLNDDLNGGNKIKTDKIDTNLPVVATIEGFFKGSRPADLESQTQRHLPSPFGTWGMVGAGEQRANRANSVGGKIS